MKNKKTEILKLSFLVILLISSFYFFNRMRHGNLVGREIGIPLLIFFNSAYFAIKTLIGLFKNRKNKKDMK